MVFEDIKKNLVPIFVGLIVLIILGKLLMPTITVVFQNFGKTITPPKLTYDNTYAFNAEQILVSQADPGCTIKNQVGGVISELECKKDSKQNFSVVIINNAEVMRTYQGGFIVCEYGDKQCCDEAKLMTISSEDCILKPGEKSECEAGMHRFDDYKYGERATKYEIHPVAECVMDKTVGCYKAGMTTAIKSCNPNKRLIVTLV